jgi:hypothetical protein
MDNTRDLPGYKYYVDPDTGERPAVYVAYLDLTPDRDATVNGIVFQPQDLAALDARERNYKRREITSKLNPLTGGRTWAYFGTSAARGRFDNGRNNRTAVINRGYLEGVRRGFAQLGPDQLARFDLSTDPPPVPVRELRRVDLR